MQLSTSHHLLPHERWFVRSTLERQRTRRTPYVVRMEQRLGPEGVTLYLAGQATYFPGTMTMMAGIALMIAAWFYLPLFEIGVWVMFSGLALVTAGTLRILQARRAGQTFRDARPRDSGPALP